MEARDLDSHELLLRLQLCEGKVSALSASKLSPFAQQEILERLDKLEKQTQAQPPQQQQQQTQAAGGEGGGAEAAPMADQEGQQAPEGLAGLEARLGAVEGKLTGVYNLGGRLIALDHMAARMGVDVPDLEVRCCAWCCAGVAPDCCRGAALLLCLYCGVAVVLRCR